MSAQLWRRAMDSHVFLALAPLALVAPASAQLASSPNYRIDGVSLGSGGGGAASPARAAFTAVAFPTGAPVASANYSATIGFLGAFDPKPSNAPVVFGATPACGPAIGGGTLLVSGLNFDKFGAGASLAVSLGGAPASSVQLLSDTQLSCATPAGAPGPADLTVSTSLGAGTLPGAYHYSAGLVPYGSGTPGCAGPHALAATDCPTAGNANFQLVATAAPASSLGLGLLGDAADFAGSDPFSLGIAMHVSIPSSLFLASLDVPSDAQGIGTVALPIPNDPALVGSTYYAQVIWAWSSCPLPPLGLSSTPGLAITVE